MVTSLQLAQIWSDSSQSLRSDRAMDQSGRQAGRRADSQADRQAGRQSRARQGRARQGKAGQTLTTSTAGHTCPAWSLFTQPKSHPLPTTYYIRSFSRQDRYSHPAPTKTRVWCFELCFVSSASPFGMSTESTTSRLGRRGEPETLDQPEHLQTPIS